MAGQAPEAEAAVDLWGSGPLTAEDSANNGKTEAVRTDPSAEGVEADDELRNASQPEFAFPEETGASDDAETTAVREAARAEVDLDAGPDEDSGPPNATVNRADVRGRNSPDGAKPEGGIIPI